MTKDWHQADVSIVFPDDFKPPSFGDVVRLPQFVAGVRSAIKFVKAHGAKEFDELDLPLTVEHGWRETHDGVPVRCIVHFVMFPTDGGDPGWRGRVSVRYAT